MTTLEENKQESRPFEADVAKLLQLMVHSVYSDKSVFLRELIANAADACERLRYEAIARPELRGAWSEEHRVGLRWFGRRMRTPGGPATPEKPDQPASRLLG